MSCGRLRSCAVLLLIAVSQTAFAARITVPLSENGKAIVPLLYEHDALGMSLNTKPRCYLSYDKEYLIVQAIVPYPEGYSPKEQQPPRDDISIYQGDRVEVFLNPAGSSNAYHYIVSRTGAVYDELNMKPSWNGNAKFSIDRGKKSWTIDLKIPFSDLQVKPGALHKFKALIVAASVESNQVCADGDIYDHFVRTWPVCPESFHKKANWGELVLSSTAPFVSDFGVEIKDGADNAKVRWSVTNSSDKTAAVRTGLTIKKIAAKSTTQYTQAIPLARNKAKTVLKFNTNPVFTYEGDYWQRNQPELDILAKDLDHFRMIVRNRDKIDPRITNYELTIDSKAVSAGPFDELLTKTYSLEKHDDGVHSLCVRLLDDKDGEVFTYSKTIKKLSSPMLTYDLGKMDFSKYYSPVQFKDGRVHAARSVIDLSKSIFPSSIRTNGNEVLAAPVKLMFCGQQLGSDVLPRLVKSNKNQKVFEAKGTAGELKYTIKADCQFDGFIWYDVEIESDEAFVYDRAYLEAQLKTKDDPVLGHGYLHPDSLFSKGTPLPIKYHKDYMAIAKMMRAKVKNVPLTDNVFMGWENGGKYCGLQVLNEGPRGWNLSNYDVVYQARRLTRDLSAIVLNISDGKRKPACKKVAFSFGLMPFPARKAPDDSHFNYRISTGFAPIAFRQKYNENKSKGKPTRFDTLKKRGWNINKCFEWWTEYQSYWKTKILHDEIVAYNRAAREHGIKTVYYVGFLISNLLPEFALYHNIIMATPNGYPDLSKGFSPYRVYKWGHPDQVGYPFCKNSFWMDMMVRGFTQAAVDYKMDGLYFDGTFMPGVCSNAAHGCGWTDYRGRRVPTFTLKNTRRTAQLLYSMNNARDKDFIMDMHCNQPNPACMSLMDGYYVGEPAHLFEPRYSRMAPDTLVAMMNPDLYGVHCDMIIRPPYRADVAWAQCLLMDVFVRDSWAGRQYKTLWPLYEKYNLTHDKFVRFDSKSNKVRKNNEDVYVSYFETDDVVVLIVSNYMETKPQHVLLDLGAFRSVADGPCKDVWNGLGLNMADRKIETTIPPLSLRLIVLGKDK